jgi:hypothetical protein
VSDEYDNIDLFNAATAAIFDFLLSNFPVYMDVSPQALGNALSPFLATAMEDRGARQKGKTYLLTSAMSERDYLPEVTNWLSVEGFLHRDQRMEMYGGVSRQGSGFQLSSTTLSILNSTPKGLTQPLRKQLKSVVGGAATEAGKAAIGEVIGQIVGAAARSFVGGAAP